MQEIILETTQVIKTLNDLIDLNRDSQDGLHTAADKIEAQYIKSFCLEESRARAQFKEELQSIVRSLGDAPDDAETVAGALRRGWMNIKSALGGGDHAILVVVESSEEHAVSEYQRALATVLPDGMRNILERQRESVTQAHQKIKSMCESVKEIHRI